jgi:hypothetical protein
MLVTVRVALKTGVAANVRSPIRPHVGTDHVIRPPRRPDRVAVGLLCEPQGTRSVGARGRNRAEHRPEAHLDAVGVESIVDVWPKYLCESVPTTESPWARRVLFSELIIAARCHVIFCRIQIGVPSSAREASL